MRIAFQGGQENIEMESLTETWNVMQIVKFLNFQVGIISLDSQDPRILEMCKKCRRPCHRTIYQELCHFIIRAVQSLLSIVLDNVPFRHCGDHLSKDLAYRAYMQAYEILQELLD